MPSAISAQENIYSDEFLQLKNLNTELQGQLESATKEINKLKIENFHLNLKISDETQKELESAKKNLENKSVEIRSLREKLMVLNDEYYRQKTK